MPGEFDFICHHLQSVVQHDADVLLGIGDDAAIVRPRPGFDLCFSSDMLLAGRHFFPDVSPEDLAHKILAVNISDMAAMGAVPRWVLLSAALPALEEDWLKRFSGSLFVVLAQYGMTLVGGDTTRGDYAFNVSIVGEVPQGCGLRRSGAQDGDDIWVSGRIGSAAAALKHLLGEIALPPALLAECEAALLRPQPRTALGQALLPFAHAAQDVSDGLAQDLGHILAASGAGAVLEADRIPAADGLRAALGADGYYQCVLAGGDDYELLFTAAPADRTAVAAAAAASSTPIARIGRINRTGRLDTLLADGRPLTLHRTGFDHFA